MKYFENFPIIQYPYYGKLVDGIENSIISFIDTIDLNVRFTIEDSILNSQNAFYEYTWQDSDTPYIVAHKYYGSSTYDWLVMLSLKATDWLYDFPLSNDMLQDYIETKYNIDFLESYHLIHHYEDADGFIIDYAEYITETSNKKIVYVYDYEVEQNELRRVIKLLDRIYMTQLDLELDGKLTNIRNNRATYGTN